MTSPRTHFDGRFHRRLPRRDGARAHGGGAAGFTIIELLVVVAIIIVLVGLLVVAVNAASRTAQKTSTASLMNAVSKGLERFKNDIGYYPPVLHALGAPVAPADSLRGLLNGPVQGSGTYQADIQNWYSLTSMADYGIGWDVGINDGYGYPAQNESPTSGIRHPDSDGVWAGTVAPAPGPADGSLLARNPPFTGKKYGPYIELDDPNLLASTDGTFDSLGNLKTYFPGDPLYNPAGPMVLCDYWGVPIRYYRRPHPPGALSQSFRSGTDINGDGIADGDDVVPTLSDVYLLRPWSIRPGTESVNRFADGDGKTTSTRNLDAAEFALWSAGPDRSHNQNITVDAVTGADDEFNKDNIVEVGP